MSGVAEVLPVGAGEARSISRPSRSIWRIEPRSAPERSGESGVDGSSG